MSFSKPHNGHGMPVRDIGQLIVQKGDDGQWSARDKQLGTTGRRMGDPEYEHYVLMRGCHYPRSVAHDHLTLLSKKEREAFECCMLGAQKDPAGHCFLAARHIPDVIQRMSGKQIVHVGINLNYQGLAVEPRWTMSFSDGELLGGRAPLLQKQDHALTHQQRIHHHELPAEHIFHGGKW